MWIPTQPISIIIDCFLLLQFANSSSWQENCGSITFCSCHIRCTQPPSLHLSLSRSLEGTPKLPGQTLGKPQVKPCANPRDTQHTMYSWATLFLSLKCLNRGRVRNIGSEIPCQSVLRHQWVLLLPPSMSGWKAPPLYVICEPRWAHLLNVAGQRN